VFNVVCRAETPENVKEFLGELSKKLDPLIKKEMSSLLALKEEECLARGVKSDGRINMWDYRYYLNMREKREYDVDHEEIRQYFPLSVVTQGLFKIYQELLGLRFEEVANPRVWHADVRLFSVTDTGTGELIGHFYLG
jgi:Zn-dependent oligopeptidase